MQFMILEKEKKKVVLIYVMSQAAGDSLPTHAAYMCQNTLAFLPLCCLCAMLLNSPQPGRIRGYLCGTFAT